MVGRYFEQKSILKQLKDLQDKPKGTPSINPFTFTNAADFTESTVEERLLRKGLEYKSKRTQDLKNSKPVHYFKPQLVSKLYTADKSPRESLYTQGIRQMISKQKKIVDHTLTEEMESRVPQISQKSRSLAANRTF